jgi:hypothetical protein
MKTFLSRTLACVIVGFVGLFALAARAYPGGTHFNHTAVGHDFWLNTMCDVARSVALDGSPNNLGAWLSRAAMTLFALGLGVHFVGVSLLFVSRDWLARLVRALGVISVPFAVAVVHLPTDRFGKLHGAAIVCAGTLGLSAALLTIGGLRGVKGVPWAFRTGLAALGVAAADFVLYVRELATGGAAQMAVPVLERLASVGVLLWMASVAYALRQRGLK